MILQSDILPARTIHALRMMHERRIRQCRHFQESAKGSLIRNVLSSAIGVSTECAADLAFESNKLGVFHSSDELVGVNRICGSGSTIHMLQVCFNDINVLLHAYSRALQIDDVHITSIHHVVFFRHYHVLKTEFERIDNLLHVFNCTTFTSKATGISHEIGIPAEIRYSTDNR